MKFESKLKEFIDTTNLLLKEERTTQGNKIPELVKEYFQARAIESLENGNFKIITTAPGLQTYNGLSKIFRQDAVCYTSRNGEKELLPDQNGFIELYFNRGFNRKGDDSISELIFDFTPRLNFNNKGNIDESGTYSSSSQHGKLVIPYSESCSGTFMSQNEKFLTVTENVTRKGIKFISLNTELLGEGVLTSFFKHMGYEGLEKLL